MSTAYRRHTSATQVVPNSGLRFLCKRGKKLHGAHPTVIDAFCCVKGVENNYTHLSPPLWKKSCGTEKLGDRFKATQDFSGEFKSQNSGESCSPRVSATRPPIFSFGKHEWKCTSSAYQVCDHGSFQGGVCCNRFSFSISALLSQVAYKILQCDCIVLVQSSFENTTLLWFLTKQPLVIRSLLWLLLQPGRVRGSQQWLLASTCLHLLWTLTVSF